VRQLGPLDGRHPRIALAYPCSGTRDADYWRFAPPGASVHITRLPFESEATRTAISTMSSDANLGAAARLLAAVQPSVTVWADTSGSFLFGPDGDAAQCALLSELTGAPATTTSTALVAACRALGAKSVDIASPYVADLNAALAEHLAAHGVAVARLRSLELDDSYAIASVPDDAQRALVRGAANSADAVLIPCTDFLTVELIPALEAELGVPIIAANPATMWHAAQLLGGYPAGFNRDMGKLFHV
jgi:maleate isomerase